MHLTITTCLLAGFKMSGTPRNKDSYRCQQASGSSKRKAKEEKENKAKELLKNIQNKICPEWAADRERWFEMIQNVNPTRKTTER